MPYYIAEELSRVYSNFTLLQLTMLKKDIQIALSLEMQPY